MRMTPAIISVSAFSITPALCASDRTSFTSSSDMVLSDAPDWPSKRSTILPEKSRSQTKGAVNLAIQRIVGATRTATLSGARSAICLGTSSPTISDR